MTEVLAMPPLNPARCAGRQMPGQMVSGRKPTTTTVSELKALEALKVPSKQDVQQLASKAAGKSPSNATDFPFAAHSPSLNTIHEANDCTDVFRVGSLNEQRSPSKGHKSARKIFNVIGRIYLAQGRPDDHSRNPLLAGANVFSTEKVFVYHPFKDDFGPMNLECVIDFCELMKQKLKRSSTQKIVYCAGNDNKGFTNAAFLLGCYLILEQNWTPEEAWTPLEQCKNLFLPYRDISRAPCDFDLSLLDCWRGLHRAKQLRWVSTESGAGIDIDEYSHYDNPANGDLHEVLPAKLVAFKGPMSDIADIWEDVDGIRHFKPEYYIDIFHDMNITTVIRLNDECYDKRVFEKANIKVVDLYFPDGSTPPPEIIAAFFKVVQRSAGSCAVHCQAGLGRTGTLIALYMMSEYGFTARSAIGWTRIVRPGSISGEQQHFLCHMEKMMNQKATKRNKNLAH